MTWAAASAITSRGLQITSSSAALAQQKRPAWACRRGRSSSYRRHRATAGSESSCLKEPVGASKDEGARCRSRRPQDQRSLPDGFRLYHHDLIVTLHPYMGRQRDEIRLRQIFLIGFVRRDRPQQKFSYRLGGRRVWLFGRDDRIFIIDEGIAVCARRVDQGQALVGRRSRAQRRGRR